MQLQSVLRLEILNMINLLSPQYKIETTREYYMRLGILSMVFLIILVVVAGVFLVPSYLTASLDERVKKEELVNLKSSRDPELEKISTTIQSINKNLLVFKEPYNQESFSQGVLKSILGLQRKGVILYEFFYSVTETQKEGVVKNFSLRGDALSREELLMFIDELEKTGLFEKVDVPISNLLRGDDISFNLELKIKK